MYQQELFVGSRGRFDKFLANGCYGHVYTKDGSDWVVKSAENDGTRTFLEWVMLKRAKGEYMKGMPLVDWVVPVGANRYMAAMKRYSRANELIKEHGKPAYITELARKFQEETGVYANDLHSGNIMGANWKKPARLDNLVLTDPSSESYVPLGQATSPYSFELEAQ